MSCIIAPCACDLQRKRPFATYLHAEEDHSCDRARLQKLLGPLAKHGEPGLFEPQRRMADVELGHRGAQALRVLWWVQASVRLKN